MSELTLRPATDADFDAVLALFMSAFLREVDDGEDERYRNEWEPERVSLVHDGDELIGCGAILTREMTLPSAGLKPVAAVTTVAVKPSHRRRGAMSAIMRAQLHGLHEEGRETFAALWASEGGIYGRFGYGLASHYFRTVIPSGTSFRPGTDMGKDRVRQISREEAMPHVTALYDKIAPQRTGWLARNEQSWKIHLWDTPPYREGGSSLKFAVHPDGYVIFRVRPKWGNRGPEGELGVEEFTATSPAGAAALWRFLLDYDLIAEVVTPIPQDGGLTGLLDNPYQAVRRQSDALWIRLVDVDRALAERRYLTPLDTVFEVTDALCPWNEGRWRLVVDATGTATVERTTADADLLLSSTELGAAFLGGTRLTELAAAGRVQELRPGTLVAASRAFLGDHLPYCPEVF